jgi:hypothetical protein
VTYLEQRFKYEDDVKVAYLYCSYKEPAQTAVNLIASLLQQIVQREVNVSEVNVSDSINDLYKKHTRHQTRPSLAEFSRLLQTEARQFSRLFIVIDGLDECKDDNTRDILLSEIGKLQPHLHLLITTRPHIRIAVDFFKEASLLEIDPSHEDIEIYILARLKKESRLQEYIRKEPELENEIITRIAEITEGMSVSAFPVLCTWLIIDRFLLSKLLFDLLITKPTRNDLKKALNTLPRSLPEAYDEATAGIARQDRRFALFAEQILGWTAFTQRPLTLKELQYALVITERKTAFPDDFLPDDEDIESACAGLVIVDEENDMVCLVHHTLEEYIKAGRRYGYLAIRYLAIIGDRCLRCLDLDEFDEPCPDLESLRQRLAKYDFSRYAARHWADHIRGNEENEILNMVRVFKSRGKRESMSQIEEYETQALFRKSTGKSLLHIVAANGLAIICKSLLSGALINSKDAYIYSDYLKI